MTSSSWLSVFWSPSKHRWLVRVGGEGRAQRQITVPAEVAPGPRSKAAAEAWAKGQIEDRDVKPANVSPTPAPPKTLSELAPTILALWQADERLRPKTKVDRESHVRLHILLAFGMLPVEQITVPGARAWVRMMRQRGDSPSAIGNRLSTLSTLLAHLRAEGLAPAGANVAEDKAVRDELPAIEKRRPVALPPAVVSALLSSVDVSPWFAVLVGLAALAGLEAGAALGLEVRDVELRDGAPVALRVRQAVALCGPKGHASVQGTKNKHRGSEDTPRVVPVHPALAILLAAWLADGRERWTCSKGRPGDLLVPNPDGKPWRPKVAEKLRLELRRAGAEVPRGLKFHSLRASFATWLAAAGVAKDVRQRLMGHAGDVEAEHYEESAQLFEADRAAVAKIPVEVRRGISGDPLGRDRAGIWASDRGDVRARLAGETGAYSPREDVRDRVRAGRGPDGAPAEGAGAPRQVAGVTAPGAVSNAVPTSPLTAQQERENPSELGTPGRNRTCDLRFRNSFAAVPTGRQRLVIVGESAAETAGSSGDAGGSGSLQEPAVPDAVRRAGDELRATVLPFEAAEATLAWLEEVGA
jgi:integrase